MRVALKRSLYDNEQERLETVAAAAWGEFPSTITAEQRQQLRDCARRRGQRHIVVSRKNQTDHEQHDILYVSDLFPFAITLDETPVDPDTETYLYLFGCYLMLVGDRDARIRLVHPIKASARRVKAVWMVKHPKIQKREVVLRGRRLQKWPDKLTPLATVPRSAADEAITTRLGRATTDLEHLMRARTPKPWSRSHVQLLAEKDERLDRIVAAVEAEQRYAEGLVTDMKAEQRFDMGKLSAYAARMRRVHDARKEFMEHYMPLVHRDHQAIDVLSTLIANNYASPIQLHTNDSLLQTLDAVFSYVPASSSAPPSIRYPDLQRSFDLLTYNLAKSTPQ